jgi:hypothetical protein
MHSRDGNMPKGRRGGSPENRCYLLSARIAGSADHRFCGPRLFGPLTERSNSCARIGGHSHPVDDQTVRRLTDSSALMPAYSL